MYNAAVWRACLVSVLFGFTTSLFIIRTDCPVRYMEAFALCEYYTNQTYSWETKNGSNNTIEFNISNSMECLRDHNVTGDVWMYMEGGNEECTIISAEGIRYRTDNFSCNRTLQFMICAAGGFCNITSTPGCQKMGQDTISPVNKTNTTFERSPTNIHPDVRETENGICLGFAAGIGIGLVIGVACTVSVLSAILFVRRHRTNTKGIKIFDPPEINAQRKDEKSTISENSKRAQKMTMRRNSGLYYVLDKASRRNTGVGTKKSRDMDPYSTSLRLAKPTGRQGQRGNSCPMDIGTSSLSKERRESDKSKSRKTMTNVAMVMTDAGDESESVYNHLDYRLRDKDSDQGNYNNVVNDVYSLSFVEDFKKIADNDDETYSHTSTYCEKANVMRKLEEDVIYANT